MAVSMNLGGVLFVGVILIRALVFEACIRGPDFGKLPHMISGTFLNEGFLEDLAGGRL